MQPDRKNDVLLIGCGRMGSALVERLVPTYDVLVYDPFAPAPTGASSIAELTEANAQLSDTATIILAIKPHGFSGLASQLARLVAPGRRIVSIMAGVRIAQLQGACGDDVPLFRIMPNTPVAVGAGAIAGVAAERVGQQDRQIIQTLFELAGTFLWLDQENDLDLVTALSGSGPAYFFRLTEALTKAAVDLGLRRDAAATLARQTMIGAARLAEASPQPVAVLREQVTSPGGTTAAALATMEHANVIDRLAVNALQAAAGRSRELGQMLDLR